MPMASKRSVQRAQALKANLAYPEQQTTLTDGQLDRIHTATVELAKRGNFVAGAILSAMEKDKDRAWRDVFAIAYGQMYEAMLVIQMALDSQIPAAEFARRLAEGASDAKTN